MIHPDIYIAVIHIEKILEGLSEKTDNPVIWTAISDMELNLLKLKAAIDYEKTMNPK